MDAKDFPSRLRTLRTRLGLTQSQLGQVLGVSNVTVNRWENGQSNPRDSVLEKVARLEAGGLEALSGASKPQTAEDLGTYDAHDSLPTLDFGADPETVRLFVEGERLTYGHQFNPTYATEVSLIDPLPHQRLAVYDHMLAQPRLRFLLADDAGAGKTIMAGLYIREMLSRRLIRRVLIVPPAGLVGNWEKEMRTLFSLPFRIVQGGDARANNPFSGTTSHMVIASVDTLGGERVFNRLSEADTEPYDLVIFDEAHKLSARRDPDGTFRRTDRYRLAEALAGIPSEEPQWALPWSARHVLLLTATPHMGKDFPYYCLWRLLEPQALSTHDAFMAYPADARARHFIRRTKEEMVHLDGRRLYPMRVSDTLSYDLTQGDLSEQKLYDETTHYMETVYNRARILNRTAARLAMSVFQRRLASSTWALLKSFERRIAKLEDLIESIRTGRLTADELEARQRALSRGTLDALEDTTAEEEGSEAGEEGHEVSEREALGGVIATSLAELEVERLQVLELRNLAQAVFDLGQESKFDKLRRDILQNQEHKDEKVLIFTEHRDTLSFLVRRLEGMGCAGQVAQIHGGMDFREREEQVAFFRRANDAGGAKYCVATDAAGEGINLQFCWLMVNYDIPWNPARLEQRMGRIHRYGQRHDPVIILNLLAGKTREGRVLKTLLDKLEAIRKQLQSDKVFDVVGRVFQDISIRDYMAQALTPEGADTAVGEIEGTLTEDQVKALEEKERRLFGDGGDVARELPKLRDSVDQDTYRRLLPGYVRRFLERAAARLSIGLDGNLDRTFGFKPLTPGALDPLWPVLETYSPEARHAFSLVPPLRQPGQDGPPIVFMRPGEPVFDRFRGMVAARFGRPALQGALFLDPTADRPYLFHLALSRVQRKAAPAIPGLEAQESIETRLVALRQEEDGAIAELPVEHLLLLQGVENLPAMALPLVAKAKVLTEQAQAYVKELIASKSAQESMARLAGTIPERESFLARGFDFEDAELAEERIRLTDQVRQGHSFAQESLEKVKARQRALADRREQALVALRLEPDLIEPGPVEILAHALVVPSSLPEDRKRYDAEVEALAMKIVRSREEALGATVRDVHTPELSMAAGLGPHPGFDLLSVRPDGEKRPIEVKGRAATGSIEITENEWAKACNLRERYWLYVVFDCVGPSPRVLRVQDPFGKLIARAKGSLLIGESEILASVD